MASECLRRCFAINLKANSLPHIIVMVLLTVMTPVVFGLSSLTRENAAQPLEMYLVLTGTVLMTPVFLPEQNENIRDTVRVRRMSYLSVCMMRIAYLALLTVVPYAVITAVMHLSESAVTAGMMFGGIATALFLGSIGLAAAGISGNVFIGYMASLIYYVLNFFGKDKLGVFYMFSMSSREDISKLWMLAGALILTAGTFLYLRLVKKQ
ncbi:hypothetical protein SAMN02910447_01946 [Ruminococcus sp. YE71]|uniref:hypothetical protein n=1 Tax=unclassified Ruminococcus TaxID=2608920 RepID=UPI00088B530B|nr:MULTISPECIES: hypothetical protein [unclassified Ruminococcus]SDA28201.1 hypothetical protein SAMN02910446_02950 [Ruminococcus sp. YE78]SFW34952.1 hypothetical protein SAMN02910447_01946 [Ruminococcus sp. YE71]